MSDPVAIDISHWQAKVDFARVKADGILGVIHKCTESDNYVDPMYVSRREQAERAGLLWGAYHFLRPGSMREQAEFFVRNVGDDDGRLLYAADHEDPDVSLDQLKEFLICLAELTGRLPVLYSGFLIKDQIGNVRDDELARYRLWLAHYTSGEPSWPEHTWPDWWLWQYTDTGDAGGICPVDCNRSNTPDVIFAAEWSGIEPEPAPEPPPAEIVITIGISVPPGVKVTIKPVVHAE